MISHQKSCLILTYVHIISIILMKPSNFIKVLKCFYEVFMMPYSFKAVENIFTVFICFLLIIFFPLTIWCCFLTVKEYERVIILRIGKLKSGGALGPGLVFIIPILDSYMKLDLRVVTYDIPEQEILSRDSVTVFVNAVVYYKVINPTKAVLSIENYRDGTEQLSATTLRNILGTKSLAEILAEKDSISFAMQQLLDEATDPWGIQVERVEIKDVSLPASMQRAMAAEGEATREAKAKVVAAEGELNASRALMEASQVISKNPTTLQLRYLQTLNQISSEQNDTIVFPLPLDLLNKFMF